MQLKKENIKHVSGGLSNVTAFGLDAASASTIIGMLTRQYSDPEMAFIRETSSNAYDAHIAAGTEDTPFDIHIPTSFEPHVEIRDYGTGLSKEFMLEKYTQVGHSTKRESNSQIGGFGIGRLSFLIVTEQAAITSYYQGRKYSYTVNYDAQGQLLISLTDERETDEPNGLRLKFPVQTNRVQAFRQAARRYFSRVSSTLPNFIGEKLDIDPPTYSHKTDRWGVRTNGNNGVIYAIMGNIAYPVRTDTLKYDSSFSDVRSLLESRIDLFFEIGEVIPLPTRENLDMCQHTLDALRTALMQVKTDLIEKLETEISSAKNRYFAHKAWDGIYDAASYEFKNVLRDLNLTYKGENVMRMDFDFLNIRKKVPHPQASDDPQSNMFGKTVEVNQLTFHSRRKSSWNSNRPHSWDKGYDKVSAKFGNYLTHVFIYNDVKKGIRPTIDYNLPNPDTRISLVSGPRSAWDAFMAREIERGLNPKAFRYASQLLPKPKTAKQKPTNVQIDYLGTTSRPHSSLWGSYTYHKDIGQFEDTQYYVEASNFQVDDTTFQTWKQYQRYVRLGLLDPIEILVINKKNLPFIQDDWKPLAKYVKVSKKKLAKKRAKVREALFLSMRRAHLKDVLSDYFTDNELVRKNYRYVEATGNRERVVTDTPLGALLKDNRDVFLAVEDMRYQVSKLKPRLKDLGADKQLEDFVRKTYNRDGWLGEEDYRELADSYELDYQAIRNTAEADSRAMNLVLDYLNSQTYLVVNHLGGRTGFDLNKLKEELSTN